MAFSIQWDGAAELMKKMDQLPEKADKVAAQALYEGAKVMADEVSRAIGKIATEPFKYASGGKKRKPSPEEKAALMEARHGVAKFTRTGTSIQTSVGFDQAGYVDANFTHMSTWARTNYKATGSGSVRSSKLKSLGKKGGRNQKPVGAIANAINSGTSFMQKQPFMRKTFSQTRPAAEAAIEDGIRKRENELSLE